MKQNAERVEEEEEKPVRHTITAEETFTLAKDVYDIRSVIKKVYNNRAVIGRRLNNVALALSIAFTLVYIAFALFSGVMSKLSLGLEVAVYVVIAVYALVAVALIIVTLCTPKVKSKNVKGYGKVLKFFRYAMRLLSLAISITALVLGINAGGESAASIAFATIVIIISVIGIVVQTVPLIFGSLGGFARWLLSPVHVKVRLSAVALEWYGLVVREEGTGSSTRKVSRGYVDEIGECIDKIIVPRLGKKYVGTVTAGDIAAAVSASPEDLRAVCEGAFKNIFSYACECGYITENPCADLKMEGSINAEERKKQSLKGKILSKVGKTALGAFDNFLNPSSNDD